MNKENLFVYEEDGFCELRYTYGDLTKFERKSKKYDKLQSNWNSLREYCEENKYFYSGYQGEDKEEDLAIIGVLDKMNELEGKDKE